METRRGRATTTTFGRRRNHAAAKPATIRHPIISHFARLLLCVVAATNEHPHLSYPTQVPFCPKGTSTSLSHPVSPHWVRRNARAKVLRVSSSGASGTLREHDKGRESKTLG